MAKGMEEMTKKEARAIIKEIMLAYDKALKVWVGHFGTDEGFDTWFRKQTMGDFYNAI